MVDSATVIACRDRVDFYFWKGVPVARSWPSKSLQPRSPGEVASSLKFRGAVRLTGLMDPQMREYYRLGMQGRGVTWVDRFRATALGKSWVELG